VRRSGVTRRSGVAPVSAVPGRCVSAFMVAPSVSNGRLGSFGIFCPLGVDLNSHRSCNSTTVAKALSERIGETGKFPHP
jgi:hypothetical protein